MGRSAQYAPGRCAKIATAREARGRFDPCPKVDLTNMSDAPQGPGWWQASDDRWYPPTAQPGTPRPPAAPAYGPPPGYGYPYAPAYAAGPPRLPSVSGMATASMVLGILSVIVCCYPLMLCALVGLPLGIVALLRIKKGVAAPDGRGQAIAGVALSSIAIALGLLFMILVFVGETTSP